MRVRHGEPLLPPSFGEGALAWSVGKCPDNVALAMVTNLSAPNPPIFLVTTMNPVSDGTDVDLVKVNSILIPVLLCVILYLAGGDGNVWW